MGVKERLREYIKTLNISEREFCRQIGVSSSYVNNIRQSIQPDKMKAIGENSRSLIPCGYLPATAQCGTEIIQTAFREITTPPLPATGTKLQLTILRV